MKRVLLSLALALALALGGFACSDNASDSGADSTDDTATAPPSDSDSTDDSDPPDDSDSDSTDDSDPPDDSEPVSTDDTDPPSDSSADSTDDTDPPDDSEPVSTDDTTCEPPCELPEVCNADGQCVWDVDEAVKLCQATCESPRLCDAQGTCVAAECDDPCGDDCCDAETEICFLAECQPKGAPCHTIYDCAMDAFCDANTHTCVKISADPNACIARPVPGNFDPWLKWHWPTESMPDGLPSEAPDFRQVMRIPAVINLTDDNGDGKIDENDIPDLIFTAFNKKPEHGSYNGQTALRVISGQDGTDIAIADTLDYAFGNPAAGKIDGDEYPEIVVSSNSGVNETRILNLLPKGDGTGYELNVIATLAGASANFHFVNLDGGDYPHIVTDRGIIEYDPSDKSYGWRCNADFGGFAVADIDEDGEAEIVGAQIWNKDCQVVSADNVAGTSTAIADIDLSEDAADGKLRPEQIVMRSGDDEDGTEVAPPPGKVEVYALFAVGTGDAKRFSRQRLWSAEMPIDYDRIGYDCEVTLSDPDEEMTRRKNCSTGGGALVIADCNGDRKPDIGLATRWAYVVYDNSGEVAWADFNTKGASSVAAGSAAFDFNGDGVAEVLYADAQHLHVYKGPGSYAFDSSTGYFKSDKFIMDIDNSSGTADEYPLVVDVDNDGHSDIIAVSNDYQNAGHTGIRAFYDPAGRLVRTRRIWNQYNYHVTNIHEDGTVPKVAPANWRVPLLNNFRQNVLPTGLFDAPNLVATSLTHDPAQCPSSIDLIATVKNTGTFSASAGARLSFYVSDAGDLGWIGAMTLAGRIDPGAEVQGAFTWISPFAAQFGPWNNVEFRTISLPAEILFRIDEPTSERPFGYFRECDETDNESALVSLPACQ
ncbi:MAG: VCBS repeat-containing protein [Myxococcales bacterium]|nr:VCBS repeat-containing protein [Myxococcales bacterium]